MTRPVVAVPDIAEVAHPAKDVQVSLVMSGIEKDRFIRLPFELYRDDPFWVPPLVMERHEFLDPSKNPFFRHAEVALFLARRDGKLVGGSQPSRTGTTTPSTAARWRTSGSSSACLSRLHRVHAGEHERHPKGHVVPPRGC